MDFYLDLYEYYPITVYIFIAVFGTVIGSFVNVVISRLPEKGKFFSNSRSCCPDCGETIRWYDLFPVFSWFILLGKCRDCKARISFRYPAVEILGALLAVFALYSFGMTYLTLIVYPVTMILMAISFIDFDTSEIPDSLIIAIAPFAVASIWFFEDVTWLSHIIGLFSIALPMVIISMIVSGAFGGGDIKLMAACGLFLGWQLTLIAFFIAILIGGTFAVYLMLSGRRKRGEHMVFGPALCLGVAISIYFGKSILDFYLSYILI